MLKDLKNWFNFNPPDAATLEDWDKFNACFKEEAPIRFHLNRIKDFFEFRLLGSFQNAVRWVKYRTIDKYYLIDTGLTPDYYDVDTRILHSVFSLLKDFIEIECAHMYATFYPWRSRVMGNRRRGIEYMKAMGKANEKENPSYLRATQALLEAHDYWTVQRPILLQEQESFLEENGSADNNSMKEYFKKERALDRMDTLNLQKIIKNRKIMWT